MNPKFSIITITFNSEKTIERTLNSVLSQTFKDYEYIIVDGASKDRTMDIVRKYEPLFEGRMKWKSEPDTGIYNAMNKGIMRSSGEIIGIVNSDDWLAEDALQIVANEIDNNNARNKIVTGDMLFHYEDGSTQYFKTSYERYVHYAKKYRMGLNHPATFVPKCIYDQIGLFDEDYKLFADADFIIRCYEANVGIVFVNKVLSNMSDGGASNASISKKELNDSLLKYKKRCHSKPEYFLFATRCFFDWLFKGLIPASFLRFYREKKNNKVN